MVQEPRRLDESVSLHGRFVRLEALSAAHQPGLCEIAFESGIWEFYPYRLTNESDVPGFIQTAMEERDRGVSFPFATVDLSTGRVAGSTRFMNIDRAHRRAEIGSTWLGEPFRRTAVNTEAKYLMLQHAFETMQLLRVEFKTDARNTRSRAALSRIGAREEGILRQHMLLWDGRRRNSVYYSVIDAEWPEVQRALLAKLGHRD